MERQILKIKKSSISLCLCACTERGMLAARAGVRCVPRAQLAAGDPAADY